MSLAEVADRPASSFTRDLLGATPVAVLRAAAAAFALAAIGQLPPSLVNVAGGGLALPTQLRVGWLYTMAGARGVDQRDRLGRRGRGPRRRRGAGAAGPAHDRRRGGRDAGVRRPGSGAPGRRRRGAPGAGRGAHRGALRADRSAASTPGRRSSSTPVEGSCRAPPPSRPRSGRASPCQRRSRSSPASAGGGRCRPRGSDRWCVPCARGVGPSCGRARSASSGCSRSPPCGPKGLERHSVEVWSQGPQRAALYLGHQALLAPNQAMWVLAPAMGGCVSVRTDAAVRDLVCLDRIPRGADPATWLLSEIGRVEGSSPTAPMPAAAWLFVAVPAAAIVLGFRGARPHRLHRERDRSRRAGRPRLRRARERGLARVGVVALGRRRRRDQVHRARARPGDDVSARRSVGHRWRRGGERGEAGASAAQPPSETSLKFDSIWV